MQDTIKQISLVTAAGMLAAPVANWTFHSLNSTDGLLGVPITLAAHPITAIIRITIAMLWFGGLAYTVAKLSHRYTGALVFGLAWTLVARRGISADELIRYAESFDLSMRATYLKFGVESLIWAAPAGILIFILAKATRTRYEDEHSRAAPATIRGTVIGCVIGIIASWIFLRTGLKGQAVFGVLTGCALASTIVRLLWPQCNGSTLYLVPVVVALAASVSSFFVMGSGTPAIERMASGSVWPLAMPLPIDFIGPGIFGIALGIGIARTFGAEEMDEPTEEIYTPKPLQSGC